MSKKYIVPLQDKVVIKPLEQSGQMAGNILIPDMGKERPEMGEVVGVGEGVYEFGHFIPTTAKNGDIVIIPKFGTTVVSVDGEDYYICREKEILGILKSE